MYISLKILFENRKSLINFILLGLLTAIAYWNLEFIVVLLFTVLLFWFIYDKRFFLKKNFFIFLISFLIGLIPTIYYNLTHNLANIKNLFYGTIVNKIACSYHLFSKEVAICLEGQTFSTFMDPLDFLLTDLPSIFSSGKYYIFEVGVFELFSWIYYLLFIISFLALIWINRSSFKSLFVRIFTSKRLSFKDIRKESFIIVFMMIAMLSYMSKGTHSVRYLLLLYPFVFICMSLFTLNLFNKKDIFIKMFGVFLIIIFVGIGLFQNIDLTRANTTVEGVGSYAEQNFEGIMELIAFLDSHNIRYIYATYFIKWKVLFESKERIIASCYYFAPCGQGGYVPPYEDIVNNADDFAYVFLHTNFKYNILLTDYLKQHNVTYNLEKMKALNVYYNLSKDVRPDDFLEEWDLIW